MTLPACSSLKREETPASNTPSQTQSTPSHNSQNLSHPYPPANPPKPSITHFGEESYANKGDTMTN